VVYEDIGRNKTMTAGLIAGFAVLFSVPGYFAGGVYGDPYLGIAIGLTVSLVMAFTSYYASDTLVVAATGAKPADRKINPELFHAVEGLSLAAGIPMPKVYILPSQEINAFATGRNPKHAAVAVTQGALVKLNKRELEGVIAHELSHVKNYDILVATISAVLAGTVFMMADAMKRSALRSSVSRAARRQGPLFLVLGILTAILAPLAAMVIQYAVSREREYMADAQSVLLTRYPQGLIDALEKIKKDSFAPAEYSTGIRHMYFADPFAMKADSLFATHPPLEKRIERLKNNVYSPSGVTGNKTLP